MSAMAERVYESERLDDQPEPMSAMAWHTLVECATVAAWRQSNEVRCYSELYHLIECALRSAMPYQAPRIG